MRLVACETRESALTLRGRTRMDTKVATLVNPVSVIPNLAQTGDRRPLRNKVFARCYGRHLRISLIDGFYRINRLH